jgi:2,4-dienoyl-CoA reductase (NADPH2)
MALRSRLVMSPMETMYGTPDGLPSERTRDYFAARLDVGAAAAVKQVVDVPVIAVGRIHDPGVGLIRRATEEGARAACAI